MSLDGVLSQANSGLASIQAQLSTVSQNVANANTTGYVTETVAAESVAAGGVGEGVRTGVATRTVDGALSANLAAAGGQVADADVRNTALAAIDAASGAPGAGQDLASLVGALRDAFSTLQSDPSDETQQRAVVNSAASLAGGINTLGQTVTAQRQTVGDNLVADVATANAALATVGQLSNQIITARARGESTADLEDKRDAAAVTVTQLTGAQFLPQSNGDLLAVSGGTVLPTHAATGPLAIGTTTAAPGSVAPPLTVSGQAVSLGSSGNGGGRIGAELDLRDNVLPGVQSTLDGFARNVATAFSGAGLALFSDGTGTVPPAGTAGFAQTIQVNPAVTATPSSLRDGVGGAAGAAGNTALIDAVLTNVLGSGTGTVAGQAAAFVANNGTAASAAASTLATNQAVQSSLSAKLTAQTGVSVDTELSSLVSLQNSYSANARVIAAVQTIWTQLLGTIQ